MPKLQDLQNHQTGHFGYSAERLENLGATEYTLVTIVQDESPSVATWKRDMEKALGEIVRACQRSPRADNLMVRVVAFSSNQHEIHGFKLLSGIKADDYLGVLTPNGLTALFAAAEAGVQTLVDYAKQLTASDYEVNGIVFVVTDGIDNLGGSSAASVGKAIREATHSEAVESLRVVLIGVGDAQTRQYLDDFAREAGIDQFVPLAEATDKALAKLAAFVSRSISAQSQALGTGGPSKALTF